MRISDDLVGASYVTDGDPADIGGYGTLENVDIDYVGRGQVRTRLAASLYDGVLQGNLPNPQGMYLAEWVEWDSGIEAPQINILLVYRALAELSPGVWQWSIYTNAPDLSVGQADIWTELESRKPARWVDVEPIGGSVRIALGNTDLGNDSQHYRLLTDLCALGPRSYCSGDRVITRTDAGNGNPVDTSRQLGRGGRIYRGWLYDHGRLYHPWLSLLRPPGFLVTPAPTTAGATLEAADYGVLLCMVYDLDPDMYGVPTGILFPRITVPFDIGFTIQTVAGYLWSPRTTGMAVYVIRRNHISGDYDDYARVRFYPINDLPAPGGSMTIAITQSDLISVPEGSWGSDTDGREVPLLHYGAAANPLLGIRTTTDAGHDAMEEAITVKPTGFAFSKETLFAWGTDKDPGQTRIRLSVLDDDKGQYDVFPVSDVAWKGNLSQPVNRVVEWDGRLIILTDSHLVHLEPADPLRARDSYMLVEESRGIGCPAAYRRCIAVGKRYFYYANADGVWAYSTGRSVNVLENAWLDEWKGLSDSVRESAVAAYNGALEELWLAVNGRIYILSDSSLDTMRWRVYKYKNLTTNGCVRTRNGAFLIYGMQDSTPRVLRVNDPLGSYDYGDALSGPIECAVEIRDRGPRYAEMTLDVLQVTQISDDSQQFHVELYGDRSDLPWVVYPFYGSERTPMTITEMRCTEVRWLLRWVHNADLGRVSVQSVMLTTADDVQRAG